MNKLAFTKMEGAGNDYVFIDAFATGFDPGAGPALARRVADRHFGVGGDGLIALVSSQVAACRMMMWNLDGSRGAMCGNGLRCLAKLAFDHGHVRTRSFAVETDSGIKRVVLLPAAGEVTAARVDVGRVLTDVKPRTFTHAGRPWTWLFCDAGNPHAVVFVDRDPEREALLEVGAAFQTHVQGGINVEFVQALPDARLVQRTFERGSGETLACGTGACAAAIAAIATGRVPGPAVRVRLRGGELVVTQHPEGVTLEGPARTVFAGEIFLG